MEPSKEIIRQCNHLHEEAMDIGEEADSIRRKYSQLPSTADVHKEVRSLYLQAYQKEKAAAALAPEGEEPTRTVLYAGAMWFAENAGLLKEAKEIALHLLSFSQYEDYKDQAREILNQEETA